MSGTVSVAIALSCSQAFGFLQPPSTLPVVSERFAMVVFVDSVADFRAGVVKCGLEEKYEISVER